MTEQNQDSLEIKKISRFFHTKKNKYIFLVIDDERMLNLILEPVINGLEKKGKAIGHFLLDDNDISVYRQLMNAAEGRAIDGFLVSGLKQLIDKYGDSCIDTLNKSRDAFVNIGLPIAWIIDTLTLQKLIRGASDFYQVRHLPDFHIASSIEERKARFHINFFYNPYPGDADTDPGFLEKQLSALPPARRREKEAVNSIVVPLLRIYIAGDAVDKMKRLFKTIIEGREHWVNDRYILAAYYTAVGLPAQGPLFPDRFLQPETDSPKRRHGLSPIDHELKKAIENKKGVIVVCGSDEPGKTGLVNGNLENLRQKGYHLIVIYGETAPELILLHIALKARELGDEKALKTAVSGLSFEDKRDYFINEFFSRHKVAVVFKHFEENQAESPGSPCKSPRLGQFLKPFGDLLEGTHSFLLLSTCLPLAGFFRLDTHGESRGFLIKRNIEKLPPMEGETLDVLSVYHRPVRSEALRYHGLSPEDETTLRNLETLGLLNIVTYADKENNKEVRLYVPPEVSARVRKHSKSERITECHLRAGDFFEKFPANEYSSYLIDTIEARCHFIAAGQWNRAAESSLKLFWSLYSLNFLPWAFELLSELDMEKLDGILKYHILRRLGMRHYYSGAYMFSWSCYEKALQLVDAVDDKDERLRLHAEILAVERVVNPGFREEVKGVFKGVSDSLQVPPPEIIKTGPKAILNYFKESRQAAVPLLECKVIIVGGSRVGKTTLMKKLIDPSCQVEIGQEDFTQGINIEPWSLPVTFEDGETRDVKIHFWDFGGQEIYYNTYQFFMTSRSLYIFVWDKNTSSLERDYWLSTIRLLSSGSPVLVINNKADRRIKPIDEESLKKKFQNITGFFQVSCKTGQNIPEFTEAIGKTLGRMPHLLDELPGSWTRIRENLENIRRDYITLDEYLNICRTNGLDEEKAMYLSQYFHDLGFILHFGTDSLLKEMVILNPVWATSAFYALTDSQEIVENKGRFQLRNLETYWNLSKYPRETHLPLVRLMEKFEICFNFIGSDNYFIPTRMPVNQPDNPIDYSTTQDTIRFEYQYEISPNRIIIPFVSRIHFFIIEQNFWETGVDLAFEDANARVVCDIIDRQITIWITGSARRELLAIIRNEFTQIHQTLNLEKGERYKEMIPCNCSICSVSDKPYFYSSNLLERLTKKHITHTTCYESFEDVSVDALLGSLKLPATRKDLKEVLIKAASHLQHVSGKLKPDEYTRNDFIEMLLPTEGLVATDRTRWGHSAPGKASAVVGFKVQNPDSGTVSLIESFNLAHLNKAAITAHLNKLFGYDAADLGHNYILVYAEAEDFSGLWKKYLDYLPEADLPYPLKEAPVEDPTKYAGIRAAQTRHVRRDIEAVIHHIFIDMKKR